MGSGTTGVVYVCHNHVYQLLLTVNTLRPRQNGRHFADDIFKCLFINENVWISIKISLKFVPRCPIDNIPALLQIMAWRRSGDKPLSEPMMVSLPTHICVTRPQWVNIENVCMRDAAAAFGKSQSLGLPGSILIALAHSGSDKVTEVESQSEIVYSMNIKGIHWLIWSHTSIKK